MKLGTLIALAAATVISAAAAEDKAPSWKDYPGVTNTSYVEPSGARAIQLSATVEATPQEVFDAFATEAGFKAWAVPFAKIDLRVGGMIEASYDPNAALGAPYNIRNQIDAYIPGQLLVIHNVQAPAALPGRDAFAKTATIIALRPLAEDRTEVTVTNVGYGDTPEDAAAYAHFEWGNAYTLDALARHFAAN
ncbi:MAG: SRPBCC domain-containing protein [Micropepsaceae bacterium]